MDKQKSLSLSSRGLKYKLNIAFYLMSVLPLLVCAYLVSNYILPQAGLKIDISASLIISVFIALAGFYVIKEVFDRILSVSTEAKLIVAGDISRKVETGYKDEVGELGEALNQLTQRIRGNMEELKSYSEKSTEINLEIHKRMLILSSLLQISSLISHGDKLENILKFTIEKSRTLADSDVALLFIKDEESGAFLVRAKDGKESDSLLHIKLNRADSLFNKLIEKSEPVIVDRERVLAPDLSKNFYENFKLSTMLALPVQLKSKLVGMLVIGNRENNVIYKKDDKELLELFAKQIAIAVENEILIQRLRELEIRDPLTGLYNEIFIRTRLEEEIKRAIAYRRPCAFILLNIDNFKEFHKNFGLLQSEITLKKVASFLADSFTEIDRVARVGDNEFAVVLPEKNKRQARDIAEEAREKIDFYFAKEKDASKRLTVSGGISENPLDGVTAEELIAKAKEALAFAKTQGKNRIGVLPQKI